MTKKSKQNKVSLNDLQNRTKAIIKRLKKEYPEATTALNHKNPLELLIGTILSAQCTDKRVNMVTKDLFKKYHTANDYADANIRKFQEEIHSTGFYHAKAKNIINCCKVLVEKYNGKVPDSMEELTQLPGVGRKTANVVLGNFFGKAEGIVVDTHVYRLSQRLGFTKQSTPEKIEQDLMNIIPKKDWIAIGNLLILHGREICQARKPSCPECVVNELCPSAGIFMVTKP